MAFAKLVANWDAVLLADPAQGYFRAGIWQNLYGNGWAYAFEWNRSLRVVGFMGNRDAILKEAEALPVLRPHFDTRDGDSIIRGRTEVALESKEDTLFQAPVQ